MAASIALFAILLLVVVRVIRENAFSSGGFNLPTLSVGPQDVGEASDLIEALGPEPNDDKVIEAVKNPNLPGRLLAIEFLGEGGYGDAIPVLERIVRSSTDTASMRAAALESIFLIAEHKGRWLAEEFKQHPQLKDAAQRIINDPDSIRNRPSRCRALIRLAK